MGKTFFYQEKKYIEEQKNNQAPCKLTINMINKCYLKLHKNK
jgi:hypothetical protein